jgi:hypothetical protein
MKFKAMKFRIGNDPKLSVRVQKILLGLGYRWLPIAGTELALLHGDMIKHTASPFLYTNKSGQITYGDHLPYFNSDNRDEINIEWLRSEQRETIGLDGKVYDKKELEEVLAKIKPLEG